MSFDACVLGRPQTTGVRISPIPWRGRNAGGDSACVVERVRRTDMKRVDLARGCHNRCSEWRRLLARIRGDVGKRDIIVGLEREYLCNGWGVLCDDSITADSREESDICQWVAEARIARTYLVMNGLGINMSLALRYPS